MEETTAAGAGGNATGPSLAPPPKHPLTPNIVRGPLPPRVVLPKPRDGHNDDSGGSSDSDGETGPPHPGKLVRRLRRPQNPDKHFIREEGIVYVEDHHWVSLRHRATNCHLYVGRSVLQRPRPVAKPVPESKDAAEPGEVGDDYLAGELPTRIRIMNKPLMTELRARCKFSMNTDHVAPFRSLVLMEPKFRQLHAEKETEFEETAQKFPDHPAVLRKHAHMPPECAYRIGTNPGTRAGPSTNTIKGAGTSNSAGTGANTGVDTIAGTSAGNNATKDDIEEARILLDGLRALMQFYDTDLGRLLETVRRIKLGGGGGGGGGDNSPMIPFSHLWFLYEPGQLVAKTTNAGVPHASRVVRVLGGRMSVVPRIGPGRGLGDDRATSPLTVQCMSLDFEGGFFKPMFEVFQIQPYEGVKAITSLVVYPMKFAEEGLEEQLVKRGERFEKMMPISHQRYKGRTLREEPGVHEVIEEIDSDIIVDPKAFRNRKDFLPKTPLPPMVGQGPPRPNMGPGLPPRQQIYGIHGSVPGQNGLYILAPPMEDDRAETVGRRITYDDDAEYIRGWLKSLWDNQFPLRKIIAPGGLTRDHHMLLPGMVPGFVLLSRKWCMLDIDRVKEVPKVEPGESDGFQKLVLPDGHKYIVRALVSSHARRVRAGAGVGANANANANGNSSSPSSTSSFPPPAPILSSSPREFDLVKGKGTGLIILLHGAPGVGKTSTAECVAANAGRPLLPITCGDLGGATAKEVEENLERYFDMARKWNCVLLLDEADVFLGARERGGFQQISLVSVFLRVLEYYSGILILTTNRVGSFDEAIKSRVHCALYYPPLDKEQSLQIWKMNLDMLEERNASPDPSVRVRFDRREIEDYAARHWRRCREGGRWNGRQIKNAFQTAVALADWDHFQMTDGVPHPDGPLLKRAHFEMVASASAHFDNYLMKVRGTDQSRAKTNELRRDDFDDEDDDDGGRRNGKPRARRPNGRLNGKTKSKARLASPETSDESEDEVTATEESEVDGSEASEADEPEPSPTLKTKKPSKKKSRKD